MTALIRVVTLLEFHSPPQILEALYIKLRVEFLDDWDFVVLEFEDLVSELPEMMAQIFEAFVFYFHLEVSGDEVHKVGSDTSF